MPGGRAIRRNGSCSLLESLLWHIIKDRKIAAERSTIDIIWACPFHKTGNYMASFLGLGNYSRRLIPHFRAYPEALYKQVRERKMQGLRQHERRARLWRRDTVRKSHEPVEVDACASIQADGEVLHQSEEEDE